MSAKKFTAKRIAVAAVFAAMYFVLSTFLSFKAGKIIEVSWASLPILVCAAVCGPVDAAAAAFCGSFLEQIYSYGFAWNMIFWMLPPVILGAAAGLLYKCFAKNENPVLIVIATVICELLLTVLNIGASYLDAWLLDYLAYLSIDIPVRLLNGGVRAVISAAVIPILAPKLKKLIKI